jgi:hypothetical protein
MAERPNGTPIPPPDVSWVEVNEPHHVELFANTAVRVYEARIEPGKATLYHHHSLDTLYIVMTGGAFRTEEPFRQASNTTLGRSVSITTKLRWGTRRLLTGSLSMATGGLMMQHHREYPLIHRLVASARNTDPIRMRGIELHQTSQNATLGREHGLEAEYQDELVTTYRIRLAPGETTNTLRPTNGAVLAIIAGTAHLQPAGANDAGIPPGESSTNEITTSGSTQWIEGGSVVRLLNTGTTRVDGLITAL